MKQSIDETVMPIDKMNIYALHSKDILFVNIYLNVKLHLTHCRENYQLYTEEYNGDLRFSPSLSITNGFRSYLTFIEYIFRV